MTFLKRFVPGFLFIGVIVFVVQVLDTAISKKRIDTKFITAFAIVLSIGLMYNFLSKQQMKELLRRVPLLILTGLVVNILGAFGFIGFVKYLTSLDLSLFFFFPFIIGLAIYVVIMVVVTIFLFKKMNKAKPLPSEQQFYIKDKKLL